MGHGAEAIDQLAQPTDQIARRRREPLLQHVKAGQRLEVALARPPQPHVGALARSPCHGRRSPRGCGPPRPNLRRSSSRGCVVSGSSRQMTTTRERSRISPSVAVDAPRSGIAGAPGHGPVTAPVPTSAPSRSASATAARASSTVAPSKPCTSGRRAARRSSAARLSAVLDVDSLTVDRGRRSIVRAHAVGEPLGAEATVRSQTHGVARGLDRSRRRTADHSPAHVTGPSSATDEHGVWKRRQKAGAALGELRYAGGRSKSACTPARPA